MMRSFREMFEDDIYESIEPGNDDSIGIETKYISKEFEDYSILIEEWKYISVFDETGEEKEIKKGTKAYNKVQKIIKNGDIEPFEVYKGPKDIDADFFITKCDKKVLEDIINEIKDLFKK